MKKLILLTFFLVISMFLIACGGEEDAASGNDSNEGSGSDSSGDDAVQEMTIKFAHVVSENTPKHQGALAMKEYIESESDGKITVEVYPNSSLFGDQDEFQNLVANNVQFISPDLSKFVGHNPQFNIPSLPFLFPGDKEAIEFWDGEKGQEILSSLEDDGVLGLAMWPNGGKHITNNEKAIDSPEDLQGLKFRTQGGQVLEEIYSTMGAGSESIPFSELYTALDQGVVEGQSNTFSNIESKKFDEVQSHMTIMNHTRVDYGLFTNVEFWESMNDATKEIVEAGVQKATEVARDEAYSLNQAALETLKEREQVEITELTEAQRKEFLDTLKPVYEEFEDEIGADVIEAARAVSE